MIPEEDRPAPWLSGYGSIEADIRQMREFADKLQAEVERNYAPHLSYIADDMKAQIPNPADAFVELVQFLKAHNETQQATATMVWSVGGATGHLATAAGRIAEQYADSDAFSAARVSDVERALANPGAAGQGRPTPALPDPTSPDGGPGRVVLP
ncbi:hypothetical protein MCAG_03625 [Micromonospora sp. ATCC 39149]|uniref:Uncharacterized protein n=1 Tax=Micromonospora carbonacea TaxID=47853 RepID=A0A7D5YH32_9ACTN|nr:hypothetical protein [Micromonospora sp. ATCC 39149]EEP73298.1 hypothetical protein MCAG_03625 [Micromonospora sp. ATCC 39149]QLJ99316.1 hypothetical protein HZU44_03950 [Micromonospora carbonacea]